MSLPETPPASDPRANHFSLAALHAELTQQQSALSNSQLALSPPSCPPVQDLHLDLSPGPKPPEVSNVFATTPTGAPNFSTHAESPTTSHPNRRVNVQVSTRRDPKICPLCLEQHPARHFLRDLLAHCFVWKCPDPGCKSEVKREDHCQGHHKNHHGCKLKDCHRILDAAIISPAWLEALLNPLTAGMVPDLARPGNRLDTTRMDKEHPVFREIVRQCQLERTALVGLKRLLLGPVYISHWDAVLESKGQLHGHDPLDGLSEVNAEAYRARLQDVDFDQIREVMNDLHGTAFSDRGTRGHAMQDGGHPVKRKRRRNQKEPVVHKRPLMSTGSTMEPPQINDPALDGNPGMYAFASQSLLPQVDSPAADGDFGFGLPGTRQYPATPNTPLDLGHEVFPFQTENDEYAMAGSSENVQTPHPRAEMASGAWGPFAVDPALYGGHVDHQYGHNFDLEH